MWPHDPTDTSRATDGDDPVPASPPCPPTHAIHAGDPDPASTTLLVPDPVPENAVTVGLPDADTIDHTMAGRTVSQTGTGPPAMATPAAATQTVPGYDLLEPLGEGGM